LRFIGKVISHQCFRLDFIA